MKMTPTTLDRKNMKKGLKSPAPASVLALMLALLLVLCSLPVYADEQQTEQPETPTVTQDTGSESVEGVTSSENDEIIADEFESADPQEVAATSDSDWRTTKPHEGEVLHGGYVGFKNKASGKYLTIPNGSTAAGTNVCQYSATSVANEQEFYLQYTYNVNMSYAYFRIWSVNSTGQSSLPVKATSDLLEIQNVCLRTTDTACLTERWQIEHVVDNYYCIYIANNPGSSAIKYALTAKGTENGSQSGTNITSSGNVYLAEYTGDSSQLWQICADGNPVTLENSVNICDENAPIDLAKGTVKSAYCVPKSFNDSITWWVSNTYKGFATSNGGLYGMRAGAVTLTARVTHSNGAYQDFLQDFYVFLPTGVYTIATNDKQYFLDVENSTSLINTTVHLSAQENVDENDRTQLFRIAYISQGKYLISSMVNSDTMLQFDNSFTLLVGTKANSSEQYVTWVIDETYGYTNIYFSPQYQLSWTWDQPTSEQSGMSLSQMNNSNNQKWTLEFSNISMMGIEIVDTDVPAVVVNNKQPYLFKYIMYSSSLDTEVRWSVVQSEGSATLHEKSQYIHGSQIGNVQLQVTVSDGQNSASDMIDFWVIPYFDGYYHIENRATESYLAPNGSTLQGADIVLSTDADPWTVWELTYVSDGYYQVRSVQSYWWLGTDSEDGSIQQISLSEDSTKWRFVSCPGGNFAIECAAAPIDGYVLASPSINSPAGTTVIQTMYSSGSNRNDEWKLIPHGGDAFMLGVLDRSGGHDHGSVYYEIQNDLMRLRYFNQSVQLVDNIHPETVSTILSTTRFFISRGHGDSDVDTTCIVLGEDVHFYGTNIYDFDAEQAKIDMSGCDVALFIGCKTGNHATQSLPDAAVAAGADCAIGFTTTIGCGNANTWLEEFISYYVAADGDVDAALVGMSDAGVALSNVVKKVG